MELNLCYGCMEPKNNDFICEHCGYNHNAPYLPSYLAPGTVLNERYVIGKLKSYNGEGALYIGFDIITNTKVQIKEYMPDALCKREKGSNVVTVNQNYMAQYKNFMSEFVELNKVLSKMRTLNHINAAIDMFGDNNTGYVVFNLLEGITLGEYLKKHAGELSWEEAKKLLPPLFTTLSLVHNAGILHRGLSLENIIITEKGDLKLTGFSIADARTANTELASEIYTGYAAPEQYNSTNWQGTWTDVYGISALLYRILTGTTPVDAANRMANDTLLEPALINKNIPRNVSKVIMNGMHMSGDVRIQTVTELVTQLFEQPEYNSVRLSSSSTQTILIPKQSGSNGGGNRKPAQKKKRTSRKVVFFAAVAISLFIGMAGLIILLISLDDTSGRTSPRSTGNVSGIVTETSEIETLPILTASQTEKQTTTANPSSASPNATYYFMNDLTGMYYDLIKNSSTYSSLVFVPEFEYNDEVAKGLVFWQSIEKNESYENGTELKIKVSRGPKYITIPEYISLNKKDYFNTLNELGIKYEEKEVETSEVLEGYVVKLSKDAGQKIDAEEGEILTVYVAKKPPETTTVTTTETTAKTSKTSKSTKKQTETASDIIEDTGIQSEILVTFYD